MEFRVKCSECGEELVIVIHAEEGYISFKDEGKEGGEGFYRKPLSEINVIYLLCGDCEPDC